MPFQCSVMFSQYPPDRPCLHIAANAVIDLLRNELNAMGFSTQLNSNTACREGKQLQTQKNKRYKLNISLEALTFFFYPEKYTKYNSTYKLEDKACVDEVIFNTIYCPKAHTYSFTKIKYAHRVTSRRASPVGTS